MGLPAAAQAERRPNVVVVITDDQGYGDLSCHGNKELRTPNMDALHADSVRLSNFHVDPTCAPTRSALMTGKYSRRVGVWHTVMGRSFLAPEETTLAERFGEAGYRTAIFGKWHLGDNYPLRPQDQGFQHVLVHGGGGVGQTPDHWGNDYFDDTYLRNGHLETFDGYCTDVWFGEATKWLEANKDDPCFLYLATNAPHSPYDVAESYSEPFKNAGVPSPRAEFYGMIVNIDENLGRFRSRLDDLGLAENTIFVFITDNGTAAGHQKGGFNAGMRGNKGSEYEGGHRVPCFIRWPAGGISGGHGLDALTAHVDLVPTLCSLAGFPIDLEEDLDGTDLSFWLRHREDVPCAPVWPGDRTLVVESQRIDHPQKWRKSAVMTQRWRLVDQNELYDMNVDPGQQHDVSSRHPDVVRELQKEYERWWEHVSDRNEDYVRIVLGSDAAPNAELTAHDWHPLSGEIHDVPWSQSATIEKDPPSNGFWAVEFAQPGRYEFRLRRRPASHPVAVKATKATVEAGGVSETASVDPESGAAVVTLDLPAGPAKLQTTLTGTDGQTRGAYYLEVERVR
ncbi:MAG: arylsulfatase [Planctomycetaceae bacterium]|nr:arylsulfatase [Planctomycetaceae bacterium]